MINVSTAGARTTAAVGEGERERESGWSRRGRGRGRRRAEIGARAARRLARVSTTTDRTSTLYRYRYKVCFASLAAVARRSRVYSTTIHYISRCAFSSFKKYIIINIHIILIFVKVTIRRLRGGQSVGSLAPRYHSRFTRPGFGTVSSFLS